MMTLLSSSPSCPVSSPVCPLDVLYSVHCRCVCLCVREREREMQRLPAFQEWSHNYFLSLISKVKRAEFNANPFRGFVISLARRRINGDQSRGRPRDHSWKMFEWFQDCVWSLVSCFVLSNEWMAVATQDLCGVQGFECSEVCFVFLLRGKKKKTRFGSFGAF